MVFLVLFFKWDWSPQIINCHLFIISQNLTIQQYFTVHLCFHHLPFSFNDMEVQSFSCLKFTFLCYNCYFSQPFSINLMINKTFFFSLILYCSPWINPILQLLMAILYHFNICPHSQHTIIYSRLNREERNQAALKPLNTWFQIFSFSL